MEYVVLINNHNRHNAALFSIEGEILNVIVKFPNCFSLGDQVICIVEKGSLQASVVKKEEFNLFLFSPLVTSYFETGRKSVRCPLKSVGEIITEKNVYDVNLIDVSIKGVAFYCDAEIETSKELALAFVIEEVKIVCKVIIQNRIQDENGYRYGCIINYHTKESLFYLRRYILKYQLLEM